MKIKTLGTFSVAFLLIGSFFVVRADDKKGGINLKPAGNPVKDAEPGQLQFRQWQKQVNCMSCHVPEKKKADWTLFPLHKQGKLSEKKWLKKTDCFSCHKPEEGKGMLLWPSLHKFGKTSAEAAGRASEAPGPRIEALSGKFMEYYVENIIVRFHETELSEERKRAPWTGYGVDGGFPETVVSALEITNASNTYSLPADMVNDLGNPNIEHVHVTQNGKLLELSMSNSDGAGGHDVLFQVDLAKAQARRFVKMAVDDDHTKTHDWTAISGVARAAAKPNEILQGVQGYLVQPGDAKASILGGRPKSGTRIVAMSLPTRMKETIHTLQRGSITHNLSGPDESGRVVYLEDYFFVPDAQKRHLLKYVNLKDDKETTIFTRPGSAMWATSPVQTSDGHGVVGTYLALAPSGGKVALLSKIDDRQMPGALLHEGRLEVWNLDQKKKVEIADIKALNQPMAWFPDGNRLAYVKLTPIKQIPEKGAGRELLGSYAERDWKDVPAIFSLDFKTGKNAFLAVGWQPAISPDGKTLIVTGSKKLYSVDLTTGKATDLNLPKVAYRTWDPAPVVVGIAADGTVFHRGLPLTGREARTTTGNSPLVGPKSMLTVRATNPATGKSAVVIPWFDPRHRISFGIPAKAPE